MTIERRELLKRACLGATTLPLSALIGACSAAPDKPGSRLRIGAILTQLDIPFAVPEAAALKHEAARLGIDLTLRSALGDPSVQAQQVQQYILEHVDVLAVQPVDVRAILPVARLAAGKHIPMVGIGGDIQGLPYIGADDLVYGRKMGELIVQALSGVGGEKRIALLRGAAGGSPDRLRRRGIQQVLDRRRDIRVVAESFTDWDVAKGLQSTQDFLQRFGKGELHLVHGFGGGLQDAGATYAHTTAGRADVLFTGGELPRQTYKNIEKGWEHGVVVQDPAALGRVIVRGLRSMAPAFTRVPADATVPLTVCTRANLDEFTPF